MTRLAPLVLLVCLLAGCGAEREAASSRATPDPKLTHRGSGQMPTPVAPPARAVPAAVQAQLDRGGVAVVDLTGATSVEPRTLEFAEDATLTHVRWSRWGAAGAAGEGTLRLLTCNPTCAAGKVETARARVELSAATDCPGGRFFSASKVTPDAGEPPQSYLRAPC